MDSRRQREPRPRTTHGRTVGGYLAIRSLAVGETVEAPRAWRYAAHSAAAQLGVRVRTRTVGEDKMVIIRTS